RVWHSNGVGRNIHIERPAATGMIIVRLHPVIVDRIAIGCFHYNRRAHRCWHTILDGDGSRYYGNSQVSNCILCIRNWDDNRLPVERRGCAPTVLWAVQAVWEDIGAAQVTKYRAVIETIDGHPYRTGRFE